MRQSIQLIRPEQGGAQIGVGSNGRGLGCLRVSEGFAGSPWGVTPPGLPQIRACAINAHGSSSHAYATLATLGRHVDAAPGLDGPDVFPSQAA